MIEEEEKQGEESEEEKDAHDGDRSPNFRAYRSNHHVENDSFNTGKHSIGSHD